MTSRRSGNDDSDSPVGVPDIRTGFISGVTFDPRAVQFEVIDDLAIFEGDIVLGAASDLDSESEMIRNDLSRPVESIVITGARYRWPSGVVPWDIEPSLPDHARITEAVAEWERRTELSLPQRTAETAAKYPNWVTFRASHDRNCYAHCGMQGKQQAIFLSPECGRGEVMHEIGHAVGLWHEQSRSDRNFWVEICWNNIELGRESVFNQNIADGDDEGPYDYDSIMHYGERDFGAIDPSSGRPKVTIVAKQPLPPGVVMGQRTHLSSGDIAAANVLYWCEKLRLSIPDREERIRRLQAKLPTASASERRIIMEEIMNEKIELREEQLAFKLSNCGRYVDPLDEFREMLLAHRVVGAPDSRLSG